MLRWKLCSTWYLAWTSPASPLAFPLPSPLDLPTCHSSVTTSVTTSPQVLDEDAEALRLAIQRHRALIVEGRGAVGESMFHLCFLHGTAAHKTLAATLVDVLGPESMIDEPYADSEWPRRALSFGVGRLSARLGEVLGEMLGEVGCRRRALFSYRYHGEVALHLNLP